MLIFGSSSNEHYEFQIADGTAPLDIKDEAKSLLYYWSDSIMSAELFLSFNVII
jgi:hypothetical protein